MNNTTERDEMIRAAHASGVENNNFHLANADALRAEANTTLTVILAAGLGALAYAVDKLSADIGNAVAWGAGAVSLHLLTAAALLVHHCLSARHIWPSHNEPFAMFQEGFSRDRILEADLVNLDESISKNVERNRVVGRWLNGLRFAAFASPLIWLAGWGVAGWVAGGWG